MTSCLFVFRRTAWMSGGKLWCFTQVNKSVCEPNPPGESLTDSLSCEALHLDVEELSEVTEPLNHLGGHTAVKLDSGQENSRRQVSRWGRKRGVFIRWLSQKLFWWVIMEKFWFWSASNNQTIILATFSWCKLHSVLWIWWLTCCKLLSNHMTSFVARSRAG